MVVAVQRPQKKEDPLDTILKGVQIAGGILGLKEKITEEKPDPNTLTQKELLGAAKSGFTQTEEGAEGAIGPFNVAGREAPVWFAKEAPKLSPLEQLRAAKLQKEISKIDDDYAMKLQDLEIKKRNAKRSEEAFEFDKQKYDLEKEWNSVKDFQKNKNVVEYIGQFQGAKQVVDLIRKGDAIGAQVALRNLFRLSGDVGAIRAEDLQQLGATPDIATQVASTWNRWVEGEPITDKAKAQIFKTMEVIQENAKNKLIAKANSAAKTDAAAIRGLNQEDLLERYNVDGLLDEANFAIRVGPVSDRGLVGENGNSGGVGISGTAFGNQPLTGDDAINNLLSQ